MATEATAGAERQDRSTSVDPDYPLAEVPAGARRGLVSLLVVLLGFTFFTPTMLAGAQIGVAFSFGDFLWVILLGSIILGGYVAVLATIGARSGLTTVLLSRYTLGTGGAKWADLLLGGTQVGWFAVTVAFLAQLLAEALGITGLTWLFMIVGGVLMGVTAYYGYRGMEILSAVSVPLLFVLAFWVLARALGEVGGWGGLSAVEPTETMALGTALTIVVGTFASGGTQTPNWSRFARRPWQGFVAALAAFFLANMLMLFFGAVGAIAFQESDFVAVLLQLNLVVAAVLLLLFNLWTTNDNAAYAFGVAGAELCDVDRKRPFVVGGVAIGIVLALTGVYDLLPQYLLLLGVFIPPLGGAIIGDYLFVWRGRLPELASVEFRRFRWSAIAAYVLATVVAFVSSRAEVGIPPLHGVVVAALAVPLLEWLLGRFGVDQRPRVRASTE
ncbi:MAG: cytosine permease [Egibacteraceae bacterium]